MCGFLHIFQKNKAIPQDRFKRSLDLIKHRGPDYTGMAFQSRVLKTDLGEIELHVASGHQRLSILDLNERSAQPFQREEHSLLFNGEVYNSRDLRSEPSICELHFDTTGDTEVLFRGLQHEGSGFLKKLNGMWAFTFLDWGNARLIASRDRYGKKPLFYYIDDDLMCFASTIRAIQEYVGMDLSLRNEDMDAYLRHGKMFPSSTENSHIIGIKQVLPGQVMDVDFTSWSVKSAVAYDPILRGDFRDSTDQDELAHLIKDAVVSRLTSDRQVGLLLSGGIDSTLVLSAMCSANMQDQVRCFIGETGKSPDARYAQQCVEKLGISATTVNHKL